MVKAVTTLTNNSSFVKPACGLSADIVGLAQGVGLEDAAGCGGGAPCDDRLEDPCQCGACPAWHRPAAAATP
jgi:hypothetical protein